MSLFPPCFPLSPVPHVPFPPQAPFPKSSPFSSSVCVFHFPLLSPPHVPTLPLSASRPAALPALCLSASALLFGVSIRSLCWRCFCVACRPRRPLPLLVQLARLTWAGLLSFCVYFSALWNLAALTKILLLSSARLSYADTGGLQY